MNVRLVIKKLNRRDRARGLPPGLLYFDEQGVAYPVEIQTRRNKTDKWSKVDEEWETQ